MTALTTDRNTPARAGDIIAAPVAATTKIMAGSIACINSGGYVVPASAVTGLRPLGRAIEQVDNSAGGNGDVAVKIERGCFRWDNSGGDDKINTAETGAVVYMVDDHTVAKTSASGTRSRAGFVVDVDSEGVWVLTGYGILSDPSGALLAANNLSDLGSATTARGNIGGGANKIVLPVQDVDLKGSEADVKYLVSPVAGTIANIQSVISGELGVGDATLAIAINGTPVTGGTITVAQAGSAAGQVDSVKPTAANTVAVDDVITVTAGGANTASVEAQVMITITPSA